MLWCTKYIIKNLNYYFPCLVYFLLLLHSFLQSIFDSGTCVYFYICSWHFLKTIAPKYNKSFWFWFFSLFCWFGFSVMMYMPDIFYTFMCYHIWSIQLVFSSSLDPSLDFIFSQFWKFCSVEVYISIKIWNMSCLNLCWISFALPKIVTHILSPKCLIVQDDVIYFKILC